MRMWTFSINVLAFTLYISGQHFANGLQDVTTDLFGSENYGTVAAFGDFNSDKQTDIFIIRERECWCMSIAYGRCIFYYDFLVYTAI